MSLNIPKFGVKAFVESLALTHGVTYETTHCDAWADAVTRLAGDVVVTDDVQDLIVALKRNRVIDGATMVTLLGNYLDEMRRDGGEHGDLS